MVESDHEPLLREFLSGHHVKDLPLGSQADFIGIPWCKAGNKYTSGFLKRVFTKHPDKSARLRIRVDA